MPSFYMDAGDPNWSPHVFVAGTLLMGQSTQLPVMIFKIELLLYVNYIDQPYWSSLYFLPTAIWEPK